MCIAYVSRPYTHAHVPHETNLRETFSLYNFNVEVLVNIRWSRVIGMYFLLSDRNDALMLSTGLVLVGTRPFSSKNRRCHDDHPKCESTSFTSTTVYVLSKERLAGSLHAVLIVLVYFHLTIKCGCLFWNCHLFCERAKMEHKIVLTFVATMDSLL